MVRINEISGARTLRGLVPDTSFEALATSDEFVDIACRITGLPYDKVSKAAGVPEALASLRAEDLFLGPEEAFVPDSAAKYADAVWSVASVLRLAADPDVFEWSLPTCVGEIPDPWDSEMSTSWSDHHWSQDRRLRAMLAEFRQRYAPRLVGGRYHVAVGNFEARAEAWPDRGYSLCVTDYDYDAGATRSVVVGLRSYLGRNPVPFGLAAARYRYAHEGSARADADLASFDLRTVLASEVDAIWRSTDRRTAPYGTGFEHVRFESVVYPLMSQAGIGKGIGHRNVLTVEADVALRRFLKSLRDPRCAKRGIARLHVRTSSPANYLSPSSI